MPAASRHGRMSSSATTASAVATSVTSVLTIPARRAPRIGRTLASPDGDGDGGRHPPEPPGIERDDAVPQRGADEPAVKVERRHQDLAHGTAGLELALDALADERRRPGRTADPEERHVEPTPQLGDGPDAGMRGERPSCVAASSTRPGAISPRTWPPSASATRR